MTTPEQQRPLETEEEKQWELVASARRLFTLGEAQVGFGLHFGEDAGALDKATQIIGVNEMLGAGDIGIVSARVARQGITSYMGSSIDGIKDLPVSDALAALQIAEFTTAKADGPGKKEKLVVPGGIIVSRIVYGHRQTKGSESDFAIDVSKPCLAVELRRQYWPDFYNPEWDHDDDTPFLSDVLGKLESRNGDKRRENVGAVAVVMARTGLSVGVYPSEYSIKVGRLNSESIFVSAGGVATNRQFIVDKFKTPAPIEDAEEWEQYHTTLF